MLVHNDYLKKKNHKDAMGRNHRDGTPPTPSILEWAVLIFLNCNGIIKYSYIGTRYR